VSAESGDEGETVGTGISVKDWQSVRRHVDDTNPASGYRCVIDARKDSGHFPNGAFDLFYLWWRTTIARAYCAHGSPGSPADLGDNTLEVDVRVNNSCIRT
jgi:hypothetical protein